MAKKTRYELVDENGNPIRAYDPLEIMVRSSGDPLLIGLADALLNAANAALSAYRPASEFGPIGKVKRLLKAHPQIQTRKPSPQRLAIHGGDWQRYAGPLPAPESEKVTDATIAKVEAFKAEVAARTEALKQQKRARTLGN
jgi:hypothetical protein